MTDTPMIPAEEAAARVAAARDEAASLCADASRDALEESGSESRVLAMWFMAQAKAIRALAAADPDGQAALARLLAAAKAEGMREAAGIYAAHPAIRMAEFASGPTGWRQQVYDAIRAAADKVAAK